MGKRKERFCEVRIVDEKNGFGLDFVEKTESGLWSTTPDVGAYSLHLYFLRFSFLRYRLENASSFYKVSNAIPTYHEN